MGSSTRAVAGDGASTFHPPAGEVLAQPKYVTDSDERRWPALTAPPLACASLWDSAPPDCAAASFSFLASSSRTWPVPAAPLSGEARASPWLVRLARAGGMVRASSKSSSRRLATTSAMGGAPLAVEGGVPRIGVTRGVTAAARGVALSGVATVGVAAVGLAASAVFPACVPAGEGASSRPPKRERFKSQRWPSGPESPGRAGGRAREIFWSACRDQPLPNRVPPMTLVQSRRAPALGTLSCALRGQGSCRPPRGALASLSMKMRDGSERELLRPVWTWFSSFDLLPVRQIPPSQGEAPRLTEPAIAAAVEYAPSPAPGCTWPPLALWAQMLRCCRAPQPAKSSPSSCCRLVTAPESPGRG
mmetsp:Transcript_3942/g.12375  ORF Transcript_3942/g.12375 Transcript_3942/m.12375 type:complete len:361 (+) Transcript_3942:537-1619(+)